MCIRATYLSTNLITWKRIGLSSPRDSVISGIVSLWLLTTDSSALCAWISLISNKLKSSLLTFRVTWKTVVTFLKKLEHSSFRWMPVIGSAHIPSRSIRRSPTVAFRRSPIQILWMADYDPVSMGTANPDQ